MEWLAPLVDLAGELGWHAWQASIAGVVALALAATLRRRAPRAAAVIVALALLKFLVPPVVRFPFAFGDTAAVLVNPFALVPSGQESAGAMRGMLAALAAATVGATALLVGGILGHAVAVQRTLRAARSVDSGPARDGLVRAASALGLRRAPVLLVSDVADGPFATGVLRPAIVLPPCLIERADRHTLTVVLAHELAHHRRRDLPMAWCAAVATAVFWFSPVVWLLARALRELREECCDLEVIRRGLAAPPEYAAALLAAAEIHSGSCALPMRDRHPVARRIRRLLSAQPPLPAAVSALVILLFSVSCLPASPFKPLWARDGEVRVLRDVTPHTGPPPSVDRRTIRTVR